MILSEKTKRELNPLLTNIAEELDITESMYDSLSQSYKAIGEYLGGSKELSAYNVEIHPQGSLLLGTAIRPVIDDDDIDIDLVCELRRKDPSWTQHTLKHKVGGRLKESDQFRAMLKEEGRRCWTLLYRRHSDNPQDRYHLDVLPAVYDSNESVYNAMATLSRSYHGIALWDKLAMRITDNKEEVHKTATDISIWPKTNPFGYALWFKERCVTTQKRESAIFCSSSVSPMPKYTDKKVPLQRVVQILKRHRDLMFQGDEDKPISIIITTLSAYAYNGEDDIATALCNVAEHMDSFIAIDQNRHYVIQNPVNPEENFADKWAEYPKRQENFFKWLRKLKADIESITKDNIEWTQMVREMKPMFGDKLVSSVIAAQGYSTQAKRDNGALKMATTGVLGAAGSTVKAHTFFGK